MAKNGEGKNGEGTKGSEEDKKGPGILKRVRDKFFEEELGEKLKQTTEQTSAPAPVEKPAPVPVYTGDADPAVVKPLTDAIDQKGPYADFMDMVASFANVIPDEATRFLAALKAVEKSGIGAERIITSLKERFEILTDEQKDFAQTVKDQEAAISKEKEIVLGLEKGIEELRKLLQEKENLKQQSLQQITRHQEEVTTLQAKFATAVAFVQKGLQDSLDKLVKYLKGGK